MNPYNAGSTSPGSTADTGFEAGEANPSQDLNESTAAGGIRESAGKAKRAARGAVSQAKEKVAQMAQEQKGTAAERVGRYSSAIRDSAHSMEQEDPNLAYFANQAADRIEAVAGYIRESDFACLRQDAEGVARRHPAMFMGGMLLAGLVLGNLAKASSQGLKGAASDDLDEDTGPGFGDENAGDISSPSDRYAYAAPATGAGDTGGYGDPSTRESSPTL